MRGKIEVVDYNEETGVCTIDFDREAAKLLIEAGWNRLVRDYCESILEAKTECSGDETAEELKLVHQLNGEAAEGIKNIPEE